MGSSTTRLTQHLLRRPLSVVAAVLVAGCSSSSSGATSSPTPTPSATTTAASVLQDPSAVVSLPGGRLLVGDYRAETVSLIDVDGAGGPGRATSVSSVTEPAPAGPDGSARCPDGVVWVAVYDGNRLSGYTVTTGGSLRRRVSLTHLAQVATPTDVACDRAGNLWVTSQDSDAVVRLPAAQLRARRPAADITLRRPSTGRFGLQSVDVAGDGWIWIADYDDDTVRGYQASAGDRNVRPTITLHVGIGPIGVLAVSPRMLVVATATDLRVKVVRLTAQHTVASTWALHSAAFGHPHGLAVTADGALWVSSDTPALVRFPAAWRQHAVAADAVLR